MQVWINQNSDSAIICYLNCYNITESLGRNTTQSVARNNYMHNQIISIEMSASYNNGVYNNTILHTIIIAEGN
jgi:hypothetical protein